MIPSLRQPFNSSWTPERYDRFLTALSTTFREAPPFRFSETPCFLPSALVDLASRYGREIVEQLVANTDYEAQAELAIPARWRMPNQDRKPLFVQADFGLDADGELKLVEIQGFPSLYGLQPFLSHAYRSAYDLDGRLELLPRSLTLAQYTEEFRLAVVGEHDPENVVLLEIDPWLQKTRHDFVATEKMLGIRTVNARSVQKHGNRLFYESAGQLIPIARIYNRVIADEVERLGVDLPFDFRDDLNVEWAGHPNWFFLLSKFSLPFVQHPAVPQSVFLHQAQGIENAADYVLKPLYSFAGTGVVVGPTREQLADIPVVDRPNYLLQRRVQFAPVVETPHGPTKIEIRVMYIWREQLNAMNLIIRMGRGAQMGVDFNKGLGWVGASAALIAKSIDKTD